MNYKLRIINYIKQQITMKRKILVLSFALVLSANLRAQVTIGELVEPSPGTLLDLNKAVKGGLVLSNVELEKLYEIPAGFPGMTVNPDLTVKENFTGAMVYHTGVNNIPAGIYVWNGTNWAPVEENCTPLTPAHLLLTGPSFAKVGNDLTFSVSTATSAVCSGGETYAWYLTGVNDNNYTLISGENASSLTTPFGSVGSYKVKVEMTNRYSTVPAVKEASVEITADGAVPFSLLNGKYGIVGETCLDVKNPKPSSQAQDVYDARKDGFPGNNYTKNYRFVHTDSYKDLTLQCIDDPAGIVAGFTSPATLAAGSGEQPFEVAFKPDVRSLVPANGDSLTVKLIAAYTDSDELPKVAYLEIRVEDGTCVCPAKISATEWLSFMCRNLGAEYDVISSAQLLTRAHHGDWYLFGAKNVSMANTVAHDTDNTWDDDYYTDGVTDWPAANNPCPAGWRMPLYDEWSAVATSANNAYAPVPDPWHPTHVSGVTIIDEFRNLEKIGDNLFLPIAGRRDSGTTNNYPPGLSGRGAEGCYWSTMAISMSSTDYRGLFLYIGNSSGTHTVGIDIIKKGQGLSVRCAAE
jgi:uncharacterized protein (TIGR02145 family)